LEILIFSIYNNERGFVKILFFYADIFNLQIVLIMSFKIYLLFLIIFITGFNPKIGAADVINSHSYEQQIQPIEPIQPKIAKKHNQPRHNRILYRMGYTTFVVGGTLIFSNLITFAIVASFSRALGFSFFLSLGWAYLLILLMSLFLVLYAIRLIDDSVLIQSQSRQANSKRAKKRFWLSLPLIAVLAAAAFLTWFYYMGVILIFSNLAVAVLVLVFTIWDVHTNWYKQSKSSSQEKIYE